MRAMFEMRLYESVLRWAVQIMTFNLHHIFFISASLSLDSVRFIAVSCFNHTILKCIKTREHFRWNLIPNFISEIIHLHVLKKCYNNSELRLFQKVYFKAIYMRISDCSSVNCSIHERGFWDASWWKNMRPSTWLFSVLNLENIRTFMKDPAHVRGLKSIPFADSKNQIKWLWRLNCLCGPIPQAQASTLGQLEINLLVD